VLLSTQEVDGEVQSLYREFQSEKEDLLDSIRLLGHQVLLKDAIIAAFIPQVSSSVTSSHTALLVAAQWRLSSARACWSGCSLALWSVLVLECVRLCM
jgi:hypothetical protein